MKSIFPSSKQHQQAKMTSNDIKERIAEVEADIGSGYFMTIQNDNGDYCCYFCDSIINSMDFKTISTGRYEWERGIEYLVCGIKCESMSENLKGRCGECDEVIDIGYYRDLPHEMLCMKCANTSKTCCYYCCDPIDDIEKAKTITDYTDNIDNLVCSYNCVAIPDEIKDNCGCCGRLFLGTSDICNGCWCAERNL
jgi:hypothetical protein